MTRIHRRTVQKRSSQQRYSQWCDHSPRARHPGVQVKWALGSITTNKASGGDGIPAELFQYLRDYAVKVLHSICWQVWKTQQWPQDQKRSVFIPIPKKDKGKECSNYRTIALISHSSSVQFSSVTQSHPTLQPHESQHARPLCPSPTPGVHSNSCSSSR